MQSLNQEQRKKLFFHTAAIVQALMDPELSEFIEKLVKKAEYKPKWKKSRKPILKLEVAVAKAKKLCKMAHDIQPDTKAVKITRRKK